MMVMIKFATASTDSCSKLSETKDSKARICSRISPKYFRKLCQEIFALSRCFWQLTVVPSAFQDWQGWILQRGRKRIAFRAEEFATEKKSLQRKKGIELSWENQRQIPPCCESKSFSGGFPPDTPWRVQIAPYCMCFPILYVFPCVSRISVLPYWMQHGRLIQSSEWQRHFEKSKECWWKYWNWNKVADHPTQLIWILDVHLLSQPDQFKTYSRAIF